VTLFDVPKLPKLHSRLAMTFSDGIGYVAAALVLFTLCQKRMIPLRLAALGSNLAFLTYCLVFGLAPLWLLHAILLPLNAGRLVEALRLKQLVGREAGTKPGVRGSREHS
jgi:hypothetical protein